MRKLLNTLFITSPDVYLSLDGECICIRRENELISKFPIHNFESIVTFGYTGASPALMNACSERGVSIIFLSQSGKFLSRVVGKINGNVFLRKEQYRISDDPIRSIAISRNFITGKVYNSMAVIKRAVRDYPLRLDIDNLNSKSEILGDYLNKIRIVNSHDTLRGFEGNCASIYFSCFNDLILNQKQEFYFKGRTRRPPLDNVNALLSFSYTLLISICVSALESVGLDPYVGFFHTDRPGRVSLALDLMEEFRSVLADRFVISMINKQVVKSKGFLKKESGAVIMDDETRKTILSSWHKRIQEEILHPYLREKLPWGLMPYAQALLLARYLRGDLDEYPPFFYK
ncbi:MAG: type I-C CRISPR-associated endonuclease Cas1 [Clostridia bacterium]|nr:type I-C CRISPR-associated endonuclease Cas1 [Clostridia bacterium]